MLHTWEALVGDALTNVRGEAADVNREAAALAEQLAPSLPWSTDEPDPNLTGREHAYMAWQRRSFTSLGVRTRRIT